MVHKDDSAERIRRLEAENKRLAEENAELKRRLTAEEQINTLMAEDMDKLKGT